MYTPVILLSKTKQTSTDQGIHVRFLGPMQMPLNPIIQGRKLDNHVQLTLENAAEAMFQSLENETGMKTQLLIQQPMGELTRRLAVDSRIYGTVAVASVMRESSLCMSSSPSLAMKQSSPCARERCVRRRRLGRQEKTPTKQLPLRLGRRCSATPDLLHSLAWVKMFESSSLSSSIAACRQQP